MDFYIDLPILAVASSVFKNMSTLPQPTPQSDKESVEERIVPMQETSATLELLLWLKLSTPAFARSSPTRISCLYS